MRIRSLLLLLALLLPSVAAAQTSDVHTLVFTASADHNAALNGTAVVSNYSADIIIGTATGALAFSQNLGKPTPAAPVAPATIGDITVDLSTFAPWNTLARNTYVAVVSACGPGGCSKSLPSDPFPHFGLAAQTGKPRIQ